MSAMSSGFFASMQTIWNVYLTDILDTLIIALFIYSILLFLRKTRSYMVFLGLAIIVGLYFVARDLDLQLTLEALRYFVGASVVVFAVVFQSEIRKYFELIGLIGTRQIKVGPLASKSPTLNEVVQSCVKMADEKTGALIVLQGRDPLEVFLEGGVELDGIISEEILLSIFDDHSEGHDGALVISNNRISKFGTHLPLSTNFKEIGKHGTRHSAALGLAENADALCIVVSEEKGSISICRDGKLKTLSDYAELEKELEKFIRTKFSSRSERVWIHILKHNFWLKVAAVVFATIIWYFKVH